MGIYTPSPSTSLGIAVRLLCARAFLFAYHFFEKTCYTFEDCVSSFFRFYIPDYVSHNFKIHKGWISEIQKHLLLMKVHTTIDNTSSSGLHSMIWGFALHLNELVCMHPGSALRRS